MGEVAAALKVTEAAAQRRVHRALEKLHRFFNKRGVSSTMAIIAGELSANSIQAAPVSLAKAVTAVALAKGATASASTLTLIKGGLKNMAWTKAQTAAAVGVGVLLAVTAATVAVKRDEARNSWQVDDPNSEHLISVMKQTSPQVTILPAKHLLFRLNDSAPWAPFVNLSANKHLRWLLQPVAFEPWAAVGDKQIGLNQTAREVVEAAYGGNFNPVRTVILAKFPEGKYDFIANLPGDNFKALQDAVKEKFGIIGRREMQEREALILLRQPGTSGLLPAELSVSGNTAWAKPGHFSCTNQPLDYFTGYLESYLKAPIINRTGIRGRHNIEVRWPQRDRGHPTPEALKEAIQSQLGLELVPTNMPIEILFIENTQ